MPTTSDASLFATARARVLSLGAKPVIYRHLLSQIYREIVITIIMTTLTLIA